LIARAAGLTAILLLALAPASAEASRKLSIASLDVPAATRTEDPIPIAGTIRNAGDERARVTIRPFLVEQFGEMRIGGRKLSLAAGSTTEFSLAPIVHDEVAAGDYEIAVCVRRLNGHGPARCRSAPITVE
jgi:hypothetical protein